MASSLADNCPTLIDLSTDSWPRIFIDNDAQKATQKRGINLQQKCILSSAREFSSFSVLGDSQEFEQIETLYGVGYRYREM